MGTTTGGGSCKLGLVCDATPPRQLDLPTDERAPAHARRFLEEAVCPVHAACVLDDATLLVTELVTNSLRYGAPPLTVRVVCDGTAGLRVMVSDGDPGAPVPRTAGAEDESGRGTTLVDYISDAWGVEPHEDGKTVWFSLTA
ncbi:putative anti-sigma regulatory factor, serine/threonine protein kinase [Kineococcus radiotolerans SRS30216 = ATCC BAA-149]|uniref:Anti-sigma regulatory factor, serine/threonine protein kinase n=1 Tax=Kineococcus radiotolerans (strain ATCC BAA-149 / DSM 14245 / SRS30216) TaxID=266940 RepID=A6W456_KINRD|nr:putative anti-sigma regulatory factor, serine/threonine protein kinase [Kineococcus radiotolerans SRS30216 = ATCC BAA-149]